MVLLEFSMTPLGKGESVSEFVSRSLKIVEESGLDYRVHAMGTILEGDWDDVFDVVSRCFHTMQQDCPRISCSIKIDYRKGRQGGLDSKIASLEKRLGCRLKRS